MQKVDLVIGGVGVIALIATTLGVVFYDDATGAEDIQLETVTQSDFFTHDFGAMAAGSTDENAFDLPANATGASFEVTFDFAGQTGSGGTVNFAVHLMDPTGNMSQEATGSMTLGQGATSGSTTVDVPLYTWATQPEEPTTLDWSQPLTLVVTISAPQGEQFPGVGPLGGVVNYTFNVSATGDLQLFQEAVSTPDPGVL